MFWGNIQIVIWLFGFQLFEMFRPSTCDVILIKEIFRTNVFGFYQTWVLSAELSPNQVLDFVFVVCPETNWVIDSSQQDGTLN